MKRFFLLLVVILLMMAACTSSDTQEPDVQEPDTAADTTDDTAQDAAPEEPDSSSDVEESSSSGAENVMAFINSPEVNEAALDSDYSKAILADMETAVDTSEFQKEGPYVIAVSQQDASNGWGNTYNVTMSAYGEQLLADGVLSEPLLTAVTNDANQQISDIENFIEQQPDAIVVEPLGRAASTTVIKRAINAGIPVVLCANGIEGEDFTSRVDIDFYEVAYKSGVGLAELMGGEGKVVVFNGIAGVDSTETWQAAALDAFAEYPGIEVIATEYAQWNIATAKQKMEAIMAANPEIDGVWAGGGEMALGAGLAFADAGVEPPKFAMVNVPNGFLRLANEYGYEFVGAPDPPSMAKYCLQTAVDILQGEDVTKFISLRTLMDGADPYDNTDYVQWYVPELNDDFIPPATVDIQYYIDGGFGRKTEIVELDDNADAGVMAVINSDEVNEAALSSDYSQAILADTATVADTAGFVKDGPYVIAVSQQDASNGWGNTYNVTMNAYGEQLVADGILSESLLTAVTNDANQQISDIENFIEQQPDAIVVEPLGRAASTTVIKRAINAGIPVVLCANGIEGEDFTTRVDIDFYEVAYKSGVGLAELMGGEGKVVIFNGIAGVDSTETWQAAALDAFAQYPGIEIIATEYAQWNIATAKQKMEAIMAANPEIDGVWAGGGEMALGAGLAFADAGVEPPKFAMVNVPNGFLRLAQEHDYEFVGAPDPPSMARYCLQTAVDILQGEEVTKFISLRTLMDGADPYDNTDFVQWYVPELNDDFIPPATVDIQYYIDGGFERK